MKVTKFCLNCFKLYSVKKSREHKTKFCSIKCKNEYYRTKLVCDNCGMEYIRPNGYLRSKNSNFSFCSRQCYFQFQKKNGSWNRGLNLVQVPCTYCDKLIVKPASIINQYINNFCSKECYDKWKSEHLCGKNNPYWKGGHKKYRGENWEHQRRRVIERDVVCQNCSSDNNLEVHHLIPFRYYGKDHYNEANNLNNLILLCHTCHMIFESCIIKQLEEVEI